jgi:hypothetical protein
MNICLVKYHGRPKSFIAIILFVGAFDYGHAANFEDMLGQKLNHCMYNPVMFCIVINLKLFNLLLLRLIKLFSIGMIKV